MTVYNKMIMDKILEAFYNVSCDLKDGQIDDATLKNRLIEIAERYERNSDNDRLKGEE